MIHDVFKQLAVDGALNVNGLHITDQSRTDFTKLQNIVARMRA
jgi:hypothetical protein